MCGCNGRKEYSDNLPCLEEADFVPGNPWGRHPASQHVHTALRVLGLWGEPLLMFTNVSAACVKRKGSCAIHAYVQLNTQKGDLWLS